MKRQRSEINVDLIAALMFEACVLAGILATLKLVYDLL